MNPFLLGVLRGVGMAVVGAVALYFSNAANLAPWLGDSTAGIVAVLALAIDHAIEASNGKALFGAVRTNR